MLIRKQNARGVTLISPGDPKALHPRQLQVSVCNRKDAHLLVAGQGKVLLETICRYVLKSLFAIRDQAEYGKDGSCDNVLT